MAGSQRQFQYGIGIDDSGSLVFAKFKQAVVDGNEQIRQSTDKVIGSTRNYSKETNALTDFIRRQRAENREQNFVYRESSQAISALGGNLSVMGGFAEKGGSQMKGLNNTLMEGFQTYQGLDFLLAASGAGAWGVAIAGAAGFAAMLLNVNQESEKAQQQLRKTSEELVALQVKLGEKSSLELFIAINEQIQALELDLKKAQDTHIDWFHTILQNLGAGGAVTIAYQNTRQEVVDLQTAIAKLRLELKNMQDEQSKATKGQEDMQIVFNDQEGSLNHINALLEERRKEQAGLTLYSKLWFEKEDEIVRLQLTLDKALSRTNYLMEEHKRHILGIGDASTQTLNTIFSNPNVDRLPKIFTLPKLTLGLDTVAKDMQQMQKTIDFTFQSASKGFGILNQLQSQNSQAVIDGLQAEEAQALATMDARIAAAQKGSSEEKRLQDEKATLQKSYDEKIRQAKIDAFEGEKDARAIEALINTAEEITKVIATPWMIPIVAALGAAQIAVIENAPTPKFHTGGIVMPGGMSREFPILVRGGETVRTEAQEREIQSMVNNDNSSRSITIIQHFNVPIERADWIKKGLEEGLRAAGVGDVNKWVINTRRSLTLS